MSEFTYSTPDAGKYLKAVLLVLARHPGFEEVVNALRRSTCSIQPSGEFSGVRWNAMFTTVYFYVPIDSLDLLDQDQVRRTLAEVCDTVMPKEAGYDVMAVEISPNLEEEMPDPPASSVSAPPRRHDPSTVPPDPSKIFIVHGRDMVLVDSVSQFLRSLGLTPLSWEEARALTGKPTPYTEEIVTTAFAHAQAIVVLVSPDERVQLRQHLASNGDAQLGHQPRPNVIWEMGLAMALHPERTVIMEVGIIRPISDLAGRNVIRLDERVGVSIEKRQLLASGLRSAGCPVNQYGDSWTKTPLMCPTGAL